MLFCYCVLCNDYQSINVDFVYIDFFVFLFKGMSQCSK